MKRIIPLLLLGLLLAVRQSAAEEPRFDEEHVVDVSQLRVQMEQSTEPLMEKLATSDMNAHFQRVFDVLNQDKVDNDQLKKALEDLENGIAAFRSDWDKIIDPLWDGQEMVQDVLFQIRGMLSESAGVVSVEQKEMMKPFEKRLTQLAKEIERERDPRRRNRLKVTFQNVLNLKRIKSAKVNISPAQQLVLIRMVNALETLEMQFTRVIFMTEETYATLGNQQQFLTDYIQVVRGLLDIEDLAEWLSGTGGFDGTAIDGLVQQFQGLNESIGSFQQAMGDYSETLIDNIEDHSQDIEAQYAPDAGGDVVGPDIEQLIKTYANQEG